MIPFAILAGVLALAIIVVAVKAKRDDTVPTPGGSDGPVDDGGIKPPVVDGPII